MRASSTYLPTCAHRGMRAPSWHTPLSNRAGWWRVRSSPLTCFAWPSPRPDGLAALVPEGRPVGTRSAYTALLLRPASGWSRTASSVSTRHVLASLAPSPTSIDGSDVVLERHVAEAVHVHVDRREVAGG
jgi:hypothetical protein